MSDQNDVKFRHGGPYDRGMADAFYDRMYEPHYFVGATYSSKQIEEVNMTAEEIALYQEGYMNAIEDRAFRKSMYD